MTDMAKAGHGRRFGPKSDLCGRRHGQRRRVRGSAPLETLVLGEREGLRLVLHRAGRSEPLVLTCKVAGRRLNPAENGENEVAHGHRAANLQDAGGAAGRGAMGQRVLHQQGLRSGLRGMKKD